MIGKQEPVAGGIPAYPKLYEYVFDSRVEEDSAKNL